MSLIETALDKLRRAEAASAPKAAAPPARGAVTPLLHPVVPAAPPIDDNRRVISADHERWRAAGYLPELGAEQRVAEQLRRIKRPLIEKAIAGTGEARLIMVSSALPGDGKTFTSINLALSMARERDISVLLVDGDTARARISEVLGQRQSPGLLDALSDESTDVESLVARTDVHGLEVLPAGRLTEGSTELVASARMAQIAVRLTSQNPRRLVLIDSGPLLVSSDARALMRTPGQIVLVVRAGVTPRRALLDALAQVDKSKLRGLIVNQVRETSGEEYYGYAYYGPVEKAAGRSE
jgi:protein-tyrosine kinase